MGSTAFLGDSVLRGLTRVPVAAADVGGWEIAFIGLTAVFAALLGLAIVFHFFNVWDDWRHRRTRAEARREAAEASPKADVAQPDGDDPRIAAAIALAIALATRESSAAVAYRIDGVPGSGGASEWRSVMGPGTNRLATQGKDGR